MGMTPKKRIVDSAHLAKVNAQSEDAWRSYEAALMNRMANERWFGETMGGDYYGPGMIREMNDNFYQQAQKKKRANRRYGLR